MDKLETFNKLITDYFLDDAKKDNEATNNQIISQ